MALFMNRLGKQAIHDLWDKALDPICVIIIVTGAGRGMFGEVSRATGIDDALSASLNDSWFWLVSRLFEMDEKTTLKTWTPMVTLIGLIAFSLAFLLSIVF